VTVLITVEIEARPSPAAWPSRWRCCAVMIWGRPRRPAQTEFGVTRGGSGDDDVVLAENTDGVLLLTLNRPDRLNAWTAEMEEQFFGALAAPTRMPRCG